MTSSVTVPAVYVGTYHQYNGGSIFGKWFDLTDFDDEDEFYDACRALHAAEDDPEFMFQDWEGIPSQFASESSVKWAFIEAFRQAQDEGRAAAFVAWADYTGECDYDAFDEAYCGEAESEADFAYGFVEDHGLLNGCLNPCASISIMRLMRGICSAAAMSSMKAMYSATDDYPAGKPAG